MTFFCLPKTYGLKRTGKRHLKNLSIMAPELGYLAKIDFLLNFNAFQHTISNDEMQNMNQDLDSPGCPLSKTHIGKTLAKSKTY